MSLQTDFELTTQAEVIRDETQDEGNTKERVYQMFKNLIDSKVHNSILDDYSTSDQVNIVIATAIAALKGSAPATLDTLQEIGDALNDDANFAATIISLLAGKQNTPILPADLPALESLSITGDVTLNSSAFEKLHYCSSLIADFTITLPTAVGNAGKMIAFKGEVLSLLNKVVTIDGAGTETIDGKLSIKIANTGFVTLVAKVTAGIGSWDILNFDQGDYITYTSTLTGWTTPPAGTGRYKISGKQLDVIMNIPLTASTGTTLTFTLPPGITAAGSQEMGIARLVHAGAFQPAPGIATISVGSNIVSCFRDIVANAWTSGSGTKGFQSQQFRIHIQ